MFSIVKVLLGDTYHQSGGFSVLLFKPDIPGSTVGNPDAIDFLGFIAANFDDGIVWGHYLMTSNLHRIPNIADDEIPLKVIL
ncbi:MAG: hypothetical protein RIF33_16385 [Cyclobacteriaceae bacterium]